MRQGKKEARVEVKFLFSHSVEGQICKIRAIERNNLVQGRESWSSGYRRRLMFQRSWVWILALYTGWTFFSHLFVVKIVMMCVWKDENKWKRDRVCPIFFIKKLVQIADVRLSLLLSLLFPAKSFQCLAADAKSLRMDPEANVINTVIIIYD